MGLARAAARRGSGGAAGEPVREGVSLSAPANLAGVDGALWGATCGGVTGRWVVGVLGDCSGGGIDGSASFTGGETGADGAVAASDGAISDAALANESCDARFSKVDETEGEASIPAGASGLRGVDIAGCSGMVCSAFAGVDGLLSGPSSKIVSEGAKLLRSSAFSTSAWGFSSSLCSSSTCPLTVGFASSSSSGTAGAGAGAATGAGLPVLETVADRGLRPSARLGNGGGVRPPRGVEGSFLSSSFSGVLRPLSPSPQLAALSPNADAMPHNPRFLGGKGGFPGDASLAEGLSNEPDLDDVEPGIIGTSSSQTFSMTPVRTNAQSVQVNRNRARHHPEVHSGYIVDCELRF